MYVSAIVPTFNRSSSLRRTLESLATVRGDELEILVVDNGSTDDTHAVYDEVAARHSARSWRYLEEPMPGLLSGRHAGAHAARGEICAFLDDDVRVAPTWLEALQESFRDPAVALAGGPARPLFAVEPPPWLEYFWTEDAQGRSCTWLSLFDGGSTRKSLDPRYVWGLNFAIRRTVLFSHGGFHPDCIPKALQRFQGDGETGLSDAVLRAGLRTVYHPGQAVEHEVPAARLTSAYFEARAFYQGVCDSYAEIRQRGNVGGRGWAWEMRTRLRAVARRWLRPVPLEAAELRAGIDRAYVAGFRFHQSEARNDPALLAWILRLDYFDYRLPAGWEKFV
jgi:glycosyltransferase involved in cell wall biosynthesis